MIRLSKSTISEAEKSAVMGVLDREFLGMGEEVKKFEEMLSEFFGRPAVCVVNGTAALQLACQAVGVGSNDEVLIQSLTYVASFQAISAVGAKPVACDVNRDTLTIDLCDAKKRLTPNTKAIMPVHYAGGVGNIEEIYEFANQYELRVIEDAAHAFGSIHQGIRVGGFGDVACFSFDGIKNITSGEGGCIVTDNEVVLQKVRDARLLGVERDSGRRYAGQRSWTFDVSQQGWRYHMSNIMAAIGIEQLKKIDSITKKRQQLAAHYDSRLSNVSALSNFPKNYSDVVPHIYPVVLGNELDRDYCRAILDGKDIQTGVHYQPNHWLTLYSENDVRGFQITDALYPYLLTLPLHMDMNIADVDYVCDRLLEYCR